MWVGQSMQMAGRTNAACGVAGNIGLCPHKKYPRLRRGIFIMPFREMHSDRRRHLLTKRRTEPCDVGESGAEESATRRSNRDEILWSVKERSVFF